MIFQIWKIDKNVPKCSKFQIVGNGTYAISSLEKKLTFRRWTEKVKYQRRMTTAGDTTLNPTSKGWGHHSLSGAAASRCLCRYVVVSLPSKSKSYWIVAIILIKWKIDFEPVGPSSVLKVRRSMFNGYIFIFITYE